MSEFDKYEKVPNMKDYGLDRPEYILKNGKARNCYGLLIDITELQSELTAKTDIIAELNAENARLKGERDELERKNKKLVWMIEHGLGFEDLQGGNIEDVRL